MNDELIFLKKVLLDGLAEDLIEIQFKDGTKGIYTKLNEFTDGVELISDNPENITAFNLKNSSWENIDLEKIEFAETVTLMHETKEIGS